MPREIDDKVEDMDVDSSPAADLDDAGKAAKAKAPATAESSPATDETAEKDTLSVVQNVVDGKEVPDKAAAPSAEGEEGGKAADDTRPKKPDDENYSDVPFNKHPRFQQLLRRTKEAETDAVRYRNVETFLEQNGVSGEEAADILQTFALAKTDPVKAWDRVKPFVQELLAATGEVVPDDLRRRVEAGELSQEAAKEISRARAQAKAVTDARTFEETRREREAQRTERTSIQDAARDWENDRLLKDPNFGAKSARIQEKIAFLLQTEGPPKTPDEVREQLNRVYKAVNQEIQSVAPITPARNRREVRPITGGQVAGNTRPAPASTLDIIDQVVAAR